MHPQHPLSPTVLKIQPQMAVMYARKENNVGSTLKAPLEPTLSGRLSIKFSTLKSLLSQSKTLSSPELSPNSISKILVVKTMIVAVILRMRKNLLKNLLKKLLKKSQLRISVSPLSVVWESPSKLLSLTVLHLHLLSQQLMPLMWLVQSLQIHSLQTPQSREPPNRLRSTPPPRMRETTPTTPMIVLPSRLLLDSLPSLPAFLLSDHCNAVFGCYIFSLNRV